MSETLRILETLVADVTSGRPAALCVVVGRQGSAPQRPGACMLVRADGALFGTVGGGCVEAEARRRSLALLQEQRAALVELSLDEEYGWDDHAICGGRLAVAVLPIATGAQLEPFRQALEALRGGNAAQVPLVLTHLGQELRYRWHLEPPPIMLIAGAGHVGQAVARLALELDFHVVVFDDRTEFASRERFDPRVELVVGEIARGLREYPLHGGCYVVIVTRGHQHDQEALAAVVDRPAAYIGMIGSRRKSATVLRNLARAGVARELLDRVHTPIGLPIGARTVSEIAVSILAEVIQVRRRTTPRLVEGPITATG